MKYFFVDGIRSDVYSGGRTSTDLLLSKIPSKKLVYLPALILSKSSFVFLIVNFPIFFFIGLNKMTKLIFLEFFSRCSILCFYQTLQLVSRKQTREVCLNHHSTFYLAIFLNWFGIRPTMICHDVLALKIVSNRMELFDKIDAFITKKIEVYLLLKAKQVVVFSHDDFHYLLDLGIRDVRLLPVIDFQKPKTKIQGDKNRIGLIGNWDRSENRVGTKEFFGAMQRCLMTAQDRGIDTEFVVAGNGASRFLKSLAKTFIGITDTVNITAVDYYTDLESLDIKYTLAPILSGAGIKLKTLESVQAGIPVLGTKNAFSGLPPSSQEYAGRMFSIIGELAELIALHDECYWLSSFDRDTFISEYRSFVQSHEYDPLKFCSGS
jgi:hypothetical protein